MRNEKRTVVMQIVMFTFFFFFGLNYILKELIEQSSIYGTIEIAFFIAIIAGGLVWFFTTKPTDIIVVDKKFLDQTKITLYAIAGALFLGISSMFFKDNVNVQKYLLVISGGLMSLISLFGIYVSIKAYLSGDSGGNSGNSDEKTGKSDK